MNFNDSYYIIIKMFQVQYFFAIHIECVYLKNWTYRFEKF
jgi:hypothetical protein